MTFTKLFVTNMVANNRSEFKRSLFIILSIWLSSSSILFKSEGEREKKAISDAEANPEKSNKKPASTIAIIADTVGGVTWHPSKKETNL